MQKQELEALVVENLRYWTIPDSYRVKQVSMLIQAILTDAYNEIATVGWLERVREAGGLQKWADAKIKEMEHVPPRDSKKETGT
jgi:hypothetical protein